MIDKIRPNAIYLGTIAAILAGASIVLLYHADVLSSVDLSLVLVVGAAACVGGLLTLAGQCATDPEPNPALELAKILVPVISIAVTKEVDQRLADIVAQRE